MFLATRIFGEDILVGARRRPHKRTHVSPAYGSARLDLN